MLPIPSSLPNNAELASLYHVLGARSMELRRLRYFLRIATEGSLGKASRALGVAQPALGRQMQMLESELGVKLFKRVSTGMYLTQDGEYLKEALEHPLQQVNNVLRNVRCNSARTESSLVLGLSPVIAQVLGPRVVRRLQKDLPKLRLKIAEGDSETLAAELARGLVDIALLIGTFPAEKVHHAEVIRETLLLVVPPGSELARRESVALRELPDLPLILPSAEASLRTQLAKLELSLEITLNIALEIDSVELRKQAVRANLGFAILPPVAFKAEMERLELVGVPIVDPELTQVVRWAVRPLWRAPRSTYDQVELAIYEEWFSAVSGGEWPARWLIDLNRISLIKKSAANGRRG
jgi:DNA-binding transcriptional LysR family regulator